MIDRTALDLTKLAIGLTKEANATILELQQVMQQKKSVKPMTNGQVRDALLKPEKTTLDKAKTDLETKKQQAGINVSHRTMMAWLKNPAKQLFQKIAKDIQLDLAAARYAGAKQAHDKLAYQLKTPWGKDRVEQIAQKSREPLKILRTKERKLRRNARRSQGWAQRAAKTADRLNVMRDAGALLAIPMPKQTDLPTMFIRNAELGTIKSYNALKPEVKQNLVKAISRSMGLGLGLGR